MIKKYNYKRIISIVKVIVKEANDSPRNKYGKTVWKYHLETVAKHALTLGKKLGADLEVVELAAYLHDLASLVDETKIAKHHLHGAKMAEEILRELGLPEEKIKAVKACIFSHRGSLKITRKTLEEKIIASADAMSHFSYLPDMFFLAYGVHKFQTEEGAAWLKEKLERSWKKILLPLGRKLVADKRKIFLEILNQVLEK